MAAQIFQTGRDRERSDRKLPLKFGLEIPDGMALKGEAAGDDTGQIPWSPVTDDGHGEEDNRRSEAVEDMLPGEIVVSNRFPDDDFSDLHE